MLIELSIPELSLVLIVGTSGAGKSTFAGRHFRPTETLSSDVFRGLVSDDPEDQGATTDAFDALHHLAAIRLRRGRLAVVDATNTQRAARAGLIALAREHDVPPVAIVLDLGRCAWPGHSSTRPWSGASTTSSGARSACSQRRASGRCTCCPPRTRWTPRRSSAPARTTICAISPGRST